jgi:hypothetical protein
MMGAYTGILGARSNVAQESALGQFDVARQKDLTSAGLQTGIASQLASSAIGLGEAAGKAKLATEMLGPETAASLAKQFGTTAGALQQLVCKVRLSCFSHRYSCRSNWFRSSQDAQSTIVGYNPDKLKYR